VVLHELLHALWFDRLEPEPMPEERAVGALGAGLAALVRDNPWLASWLARYAGSDA
jgi:hypothetical protein